MKRIKKKEKEEKWMREEGRKEKKIQKAYDKTRIRWKALEGRRRKRQEDMRRLHAGTEEEEEEEVARERKEGK